MGIVAGYAGGRLPQWLERWGRASSPLVSLPSRAVGGERDEELAVVLSRLRLGPAPPQDRRIRPPSRPLLRFLAAACRRGNWARHVQSVFQCVPGPAAVLGRASARWFQFRESQVGAILLAPGIPRFGRLRGIAGCSCYDSGAGGTGWFKARRGVVPPMCLMAAQYMMSPHVRLPYGGGCGHATAEARRR
jgi:hypothetical protein